MVKNLSAHQTQARVHKWKWGGFGNLRYCCELVLPKMMHLLNHKQKQLRWGVDYYEEMLPNGREKHGCRGRLICISISGTLGCPGRAAGLSFVKDPNVSWEESWESPWNVLHRESQLVKVGRERLTMSLWHSQEASCSETGGRHKARGQPQSECEAVEFYLAKHRLSPEPMNSLEKAASSEKETFWCYL